MSNVAFITELLRALVEHEPYARDRAISYLADALPGWDDVCPCGHSYALQHPQHAGGLCIEGCDEGLCRSTGDEPNEGRLLP